MATLNENKLIPTNQLPSYVDDVLEFATLSVFPVTGETGKIYVDIATNRTYRWSGSAYIYITSGAVDSVAGKTGIVTLVKADVGLSNVDNTADANKSVSIAANATSHIAAVTGAEHGAVSTNTANMIVRRDASGNFTAGTITAALSGSCSGSSGSCTGNAVTSSSCSGNAATATTASSCSGNAATSSSCSGNAATCTTATNLSGGYVAATTITATGNITAYYSDSRLKDFHGTIPDALAKVLSLNGYYFTENEVAKSLGCNNDQMQVGVSAQEVENVMPEVVTSTPIVNDQNYKAVWYDKLIPLLIEAIKEQQIQIEELKRR